MRMRERERKMNEFAGVCEGKIETWKRKGCVSRSSRDDGGAGGGSATKVKERIKDRTCRAVRQVHANGKPFDRSWRCAKCGREWRECESMREREREIEQERKQGKKMDRGKLVGLLSFFKVIDRCRRKQCRLK